MAAIVSGNSLGLLNSSLYVLGSQGALGQASQGRAGEQVFVNADTGNLIIQNRDDLLVSRGPDLSLLRTYNSQGLLDGDNNDNWRMGVYRKVTGLTGTPNATGSTVTRVAEDGSESVYTFDATLGKYVCHDGGGAYDTLTFNSGTQKWTWSWTDGTTQLTELYDAANDGRITQVFDQDSNGQPVNGLTFSYNAAGLIARVDDASGETTFLDYAGTDLTQLLTVITTPTGPQTLIRTSYGYDTSHRLTSVTTDLTPDKTNDAVTYVVNYTYEGTSKRVATLTQTDGNNLTFTYVQVGSDFKVATYKDGNDTVTTLSYAQTTFSTPTSAPADNAVLSTTITTNTNYPVVAGLTNPVVGWNTAALVAGSSTTSASAPQVRFDQNGNGMAVWALGTDLFYGLYTKNNDTWSAAATLDGTLAGSPTKPNLSMSANGNALVTWVQNNNVYARRYIAGVWDGATTIPNLENLTGAVFNPVGAINNNGRAVVAFIQTNGTPNNLYANVFNGTTWATAATAVDDIGTANTNSITNTTVPSVAIDSLNNATVLWLQKTGTETVDSLNFSRFNPSTSTWSARNNTTLENTTTAVTAQSIAFDGNGNGIAIWLQGGSLFAKSYTRTTNAWSASTTLGTAASAPNLSMSANGNGLVTWVNANNILARRYSAGAWVGANATLENAAGVASSPVGSINDAGQAAVVFVQAGTTTDVYANRFTGSAWQTAATLIESNANSVAATMTPSVAIDAQGNVSALWLQKNGAQTTDSVYRNRFNTDATPYYTIPGSADWNTIASAVYGSSAPATQLQSSLGNPPLTPNNRLTGFQTLTVSTTSTVPPYYAVQASDTWTGITQKVYHTSDPNAVAALQADLGLTGQPLPAAGTRLNVHQTLSYNQTTAGVQTDIRDSLGLVTTMLTNAQGQLTQILMPAVGGVRQSASYAYNANGDVTQVTDARGLVTTFGYDANGNRKLERDAAGNTIERVFDTSSSRLLAETTYLVPDPDGEGSALPASPLTTRYVYDTGGHLRFVVSGEGRVTEYRYNSFGQRVAAIRYTGKSYDVGALTPTSPPLTETNLTDWLPADKSASIRVDTAYDFRGQVSTTTSYETVNAAGVGVDDLGKAMTKYVYDQAGNLAQTIGARGSATDDPAFTTSYLYDGLGRLKQTVDAAGLTLTEYDDANRQTVLTLANGLKTTSTYDAAGRLVSVLQSENTLALGTTKYFYDADGRLRRTEDPTGVKTHILYDEAGRRIATIDGTGSLTEYRYDADNNLTRTIRYATALTAAQLSSLTDAQGPTGITLSTSPAGPGIRPTPSGLDRSTWNSYDSANRLVKSVDELGFVTESAYDGAGQLLKTTKFAKALLSTAGLGDTPTPAAINPVPDADDRVTREFYDADGKLRGTLDAEGYLVEYKYDKAGQLIESVGYSKVTDLSPTLRASGTLAQLIPVETPTEILNDIHSYTLYNARGQVVGQVDGEGYFTEYAYDTAGNKIRVIRYATMVGHTPDATLASLRLLANQPSPNPEDQVTAYTYTSLNQLKTEQNPEGTITEYTYDTVGNLTKTVKGVNTNDVRGFAARYDAQGRVKVQLSSKGVAALAVAQTQADIDAAWATFATSYEYDAAGRKTSATDAKSNKTLFYYDADGRLVYSINALGEVSENRYNALGQLTHVIAYGTRLNSLAGLVGGFADAVSAAVAAIATGTDSITRYSYTLRGQVASATDARGFVTSETYGAFGDITASTQDIDVGRTLDHTYTYDHRGLLKTTVWDPLDLHTTYSTEYDAFGRATQTTDSRGNVRTVAYDRLGRAVTTTVDPGAGHLAIGTSTTYDAFDRVLTLRDGLNNVTTFTYDKATRSVKVKTPEQIVSTTVKNRYGEVQSVEDGRLNTTTFGYDADGHLTSVDRPDTAPTTSQYNEIGQLESTKDANGTITSYEYDKAGRLKKRTVDPGTGHLNLVTQYDYDAKGQTISVTDPRGIVTSTEFNLKGEVTRVTVDPGGLNLKTAYTYDGRGKTLTVTEGEGSAQPRVTQYDYDKLGRRIRERLDPNGINATTLYDYDKNGNVARKTDANGNVTRYAYDAKDRLVFTVDALGDVTKNEYDANDRAIRTIAYATPLSAAVLAALPPAPALTDINPVQTGAIDRVRCVYDKDGREIFTIDALGGVTQKVYDHNGNVIRTIAYANALQGTFAPGVAPQILASAPAAGSTFSYVIADGTRDRVERTAYDAANRLRFQIDAANYVKETRYDEGGRIAQTIQYVQQVALGDEPTVAQVAAAVAPELIPVTSTNLTETLFAGPDQLYPYSATARDDIAAPATQSVGVTSTTAPVMAPPVQPYTYAASAQQDTATPATQSVAITNTSQTNSTPPVQPFTYVASAKNDVASAATQAGTLTVQNTSQLQSGIVKNFAWYRSGSTLVTGGGISLDVGSASRIDNTPTQVRADLYLNGVYYTTTYTDVGFANTEQWTTNESGAWVQNGEGGFYNHWYGVGNWTGQVNLSTGALPAGNYTISLFTTDDAGVNPGDAGEFDFTDGTWSASNTYNVTIGTVAQPTLVSWPTSLQPSGTTASFKYRPAGSTGAFTSVAVGVSGANHQVNLGAVAAGNYEYIIEYRDSFNRVLKSSTGTLSTTAGQTTSTGATFNFTQVTSTAAAGSSISGYIPLNQVSTIDRVSATVTDANTGLVVTSNVVTYPEFEAGYNGEVNLKVGSQLANGRYNVAITVFFKNGTIDARPAFLYEVGPQNWIAQMLSWPAGTAPAGTTPSFGYRVSGSTGAFTPATVSLVGANHQAAFDHIATGTYEYQIQYKDSFNRVLKSSTGTFNVTGSGTATLNATFNFTQVTSVAAAGSSITGYITPAEVSAIDFVDATVRDLVGNVVSTARTYPEFEPSYNGRVNLKVGAVLADGAYTVSVTIRKKDGSTDARPAFAYEVGMQPTWHPVQPFTYVASAKNDVASAATQAGTLTVQNTSQLQSGIVKNFAWYRSGSTLVTGGGISLDVGSASRIDNTPTQVRADLYLNGVYYTTTYTDVGFANTELWSERGGVWSQAPGEGGSFNHWYGVGNWTGQVNLSAGALPAGNYTINVFTTDDAGVNPGDTGEFDLTDGTWSTSNTYNVTIGTIVQPTLVSWPTSLQPSGTTVSFKFRAAGSTGAYTALSVGVSGANHQVNLGAVAAGNYEYIIEYRDSFNRVLKSATGTLSTTAGQTTSTGATFNTNVQVTSTPAAGSSISGYIPLNQVSTIDRVTATVTDANTGLVVTSNVVTYPEFEAGYNGEVNLKVGSQLANGRYNVAITVFFKDGTIDARPAFLYEVGQQTRLGETLTWAATTQPVGTTVSFLYRLAGTGNPFQSMTVTTAGGNQQVSFSTLPAGSYDYQIQYRDSFNRVVKSATGIFTVTSTASSTTTATPFGFTQVTSTAMAGSSISGYIPPSQFSSIDYIEATVRDLAGNVVSTECTYPGFEPGYNGQVNLKAGAPLPDGGQFNITIRVYYKNGTIEDKPNLYYEVGPQPFQRRTTTVSWAVPTGVSGATAQFSYAPSGSSTFVSAAVTQNGANQQAALVDAASGTYAYRVSYYNGAQLIKQASGTFAVSGSGSAGAQLHFLADPAYDPDEHKQVNTFEYDAAGRLKSSRDPEASANPQLLAETYTYDEVGNKTTFTNKKGATWTYVYDHAGRLTGEISPAVDITTVDPTTLAVTSSPTPVPIETRMEYDALGHVKTRTEAYGRIGEQRTTEYRYDALGRQTKTIYPTVSVYNETAADLTTNGIDGTIRPRQQTELTLAPETNVTFDAAGNAVVNRDAAGNTSYKVYDALGRVKYEIDAEGYVTEYGFDTFGDQTTVTRYSDRLDFGANPSKGYAQAHTAGAPFTAADVATRLSAQTPPPPNSVNAGSRTITTEYDELGRAKLVKEPAVFTFDSSPAVGSPQYFTVGRTTKNLYNAFGQLVKQSILKNPGADLAVSTLDDTWLDTFYYYDARGNKSAQIDALGFLTTWEYDETGDVVRQVEYAAKLSAASWSVSGFSKPASLTSDDRQTVYAYDRKNQKVAETKVGVEFTKDTAAPDSAPELQTVVGDLTTTYGYDAVGNLTRVTTPLGASTYTYYDALGRVVAVAEPLRASTTSSGKVVIPPVFVSYDPSSNAATLSIAKNAPSATVVGLRYKAAGAATWNPPANLVLSADGTTYTVTSPDLRTDHYEYEITYKQNGATEPYATGTGQFDILGPSSASSTNVAATVEKPALSFTQVAGAHFTTENGFEVPIGAESGYGARWSALNQVNFAWNSLNALGAGDVRVRVNYLTYHFDYNETSGDDPRVSEIQFLDGINTFHEQTFSASDAAAGVSLAWNDPDLHFGFNTVYAGIQAITSVEVWKVVGGQEIQVINSSASYDRPDRLLIRGKTAGLTAINVAGVGQRAVTSLGSGVYTVDLSGLARGTYSFTPVGTATSVGGTFEVTHSSIAGPAGVQEFNPGSINRTLNVFSLPAAPVNTPLSVQMQYRVLGDTGPYLTKTFQAPSASGGDFTASYDDIANGVYEFILTARDANGTLLNLGTAATGTIRIDRGGALPSVAQVGGSAQIIPLTSMSYNAFGDVALTTKYAKGATGADPTSVGKPAPDVANDQITRRAYDNHGNVIVSVDPEGAPTYRSYDAMDRVAKTWQAINTNDRLANGAPVVNNAVKVFHYDKVGHEIDTVEPSYLPTETLATNTLAPAAQALSTSWGLVGSETLTSFGETGYGWGGGNSVSVGWNEMASWGGGNVRVDVYYTAYQAVFHSATGGTEAGYTAEVGPQLSVSQEFGAAAAATGATVTWFDASNGPYGGIYSVDRVVVWKRDAGGQLVLIHDRSTQGTYGNKITLAVPQQPGTGVTFKSTPHGQSSWSAATLYNMGAQYLVDVSGLSGTYDYEILYTRPSEAAPSSHVQGTFSAGASVVTAFANGNSAATSFALPALNPANFATTQVKYNAFGEITAKGLNNGWQEQFEYDDAGHLWRTNQNDGVNRVYLYDVQGKATASIESQGLDLRAYSGPDAVAGLASGVQRTNALYDGRGRAVGQVQQAFTIATAGLEANPAPLALTHAGLNFSVSFTSEGNSAFLSWNDLSALGNGNVLVEVFYGTEAGFSGGTESGYYSTEIASTDAATVASLGWTDSHVFHAEVKEVKVSKRDAAGTLVTIFDQTVSGSFNNLITWPASIAGSGVTAQYSPVSGGAPTPLAVYNMGSSYLVNTRDWAPNSYNLEVFYARPGDSAPFSHSTATVTVNGGSGSLTLTTVPVNTSPQLLRPVVSQTLDRWGNVLSVTDANGNTTSYRYNYRDEMTEEKKALTDIWDEHGVKTRDTPTTRNLYDALGRNLSTVDPNGNETKSRYDDAGQLITEYHPDGGVVHNQYDVLGRLTRTIDSTGVFVDSFYDRDNRVVKVQHPIGEENYAYDQAGNRISATNAAGEKTKYWYDTRGKLIRTQLPGGQETNVYYDLRGNKVREVNANNDQPVWEYDYFGRLKNHTDLGGHQYHFDYDQAGHLKTQTLTPVGSGAVATTYDYYENGAVRRITDAGVSGETFYEYDRAGNRTRERYMESGTVYRDNIIKFDELGRMVGFNDNRYTATYVYDANGNRREEKVTYFDNANQRQDLDYWYKYDQMNRLKLSQGKLVGGTGGTIQITPGRGVEIDYRSNGERQKAVTQSGTEASPGARVEETYTYDFNGRLKTTIVDGKEASFRDYDDAGRVKTFTTYSTPGTKLETRSSTYDVNGWLRTQDIVNGAGTTTQSIVYTGYDGLGNVTSYQVSINTGTPHTNFYSYEYAKFETYKERVVHGSSNLLQPGDTTTGYDVNGNIRSVTDQFGTNRSRTFITDSSGQILRKTENLQTQYYFYAGGKPVGSTGELSAADFDFNYTPVSPQYPAPTPGTYVVSEGDTLRRIALTVFGDAQLWYLIADANGIRSESEALKVGQQLVIPNRVTNLHNDSQTYQVYHGGKIIGDTTPTLLPPPPPRPSGGGFLGILIAIIIIIVVIVVLYYTGYYIPGSEELAAEEAGVGAAEYGAEYGAAEYGAESGAEYGLEEYGTEELAADYAAEGTVTESSTATQTIARAAIQNAAKQAIAQLQGEQNGFNWRSFGAAVVSASITSGITDSFGEDGIAGSGGLGIEDETGRMMVNAAISSAMNQGVNMALGEQKKFDWRGVAAAAIAAPIMKYLGAKVAAEVPDGYQKVATGVVNAATKGTVSALLGTGGRFDLKQILADQFGNLLADSLVSQDAFKGQQTETLDDAETERRNAEDAARDIEGSSVSSGRYSEDATRDVEGSSAGGVTPAPSEIGPQAGNLRMVYHQGIDDGQFTRTSEIGGHFTKAQLLGQAFVGAVNPATGKTFTQDDLNLLVAYSQFPDQVKDFDALAAGLRYFNPFSRNFLDSDMRLLQESLHSLNSYGAEWNIDRGLAIVNANPGDLALAGMTMHPFEDARPHEGFNSIFGHAVDSIDGHSPDYMSPGLAARTGPDMIRFLEAVTGVSADTVLPGQAGSIRDVGMGTLNRALELVDPDAKGAEFERQFNQVARGLLPEEALKLPTLPSASFTANTPREALIQTAGYLNSIGLNVNPGTFLANAFDAYIHIANKYLEQTGGVLSSGERVSPIDRERLQPNPVPVNPYRRYGAKI